MIRRLLAVILLPLSACVSYETDPNKIPEPVQASPAAPGAVSTASEPVMTASDSGHSGRASEPGAEAPNPVRTPAQVTRVGGDMKAQVEMRDGEFRFGPARIEGRLPAG